MRKLFITGSATAAFVLGTFAFADNHDHEGNKNDNKGACVSSCARAAAEMRKQCAVNAENEDEMRDCEYTAKQSFKDCKGTCQAGDDDNSEAKSKK